MYAMFDKGENITTNDIKISRVRQYDTFTF